MMMIDGFRFLLFATLFFSPSFDAHSHPSRFTEDDDDASERELVNPWPLDEALNGHDARRNEILEKLQQVRFFLFSFPPPSSPSPSVTDGCETFVRREKRKERPTIGIY